MCGIIGYIGPKEVVPVLIEGLRRLEYRGYDSAGVAVVHDGEVAAGAAGVAQRDTIFRIASMSKPITAVATMLLVEECVVRLDDPVDALLPELADRRARRAAADAQAAAASAEIAELDPRVEDFRAARETATSLLLGSVPSDRPNATNVRLTAFSMISIESRTVMRFFRRKTPAVPIENRIAETMR